MIINQWHLEDAISELEKGYVQSLIELIKIPVFEKAILKDMEIARKALWQIDTKEFRESIKDQETVSEEDSIISRDILKLDQLEDTLSKNKVNKNGHLESLSNVEAILNEVYKLRK